MHHVVSGIAWLLEEHPRETLHVSLNILALASVTGACMWQVSDTCEQGKKRRGPRRRRR